MTALEVLGFVLFLALILGLNLAWRGYRDRVEGGRFEQVTRPGGPGLETELGTIWVDEAAGKLWIERDGGSPSFVWLRDIERVNVAVTSTEVPFEEFLFEGWQLTDFMHRYRDVRTSWEVSLLTRHTPVVIADLRQYKKRDFLDVATPVQHWILAKLGRYREGEAVVAELRQTLEALVMRPVTRSKASSALVSDR